MVQSHTAKASLGNVADRRPRVRRPDEVDIGDIRPGLQRILEGGALAVRQGVKGVRLTAVI